jgi:hypothetical protein
MEYLVQKNGRKTLRHMLKKTNNKSELLTVQAAPTVETKVTMKVTIIIVATVTVAE